MVSCTRRPPNQPKTHRPRAWFPPHLPPMIRFSFSPVSPAMSINAVPTKPPIMDHDKSSNGFMLLPLDFVSSSASGYGPSRWRVTGSSAFGLPRGSGEALRAPGTVRPRGGNRRRGSAWMSPEEKVARKIWWGRLLVGCLRAARDRPAGALTQDSTHA